MQQQTAAPAAAGVAEHGPPALALTGIVKSFGGRRVLDDASLAVARGEVHALLGENGAGKSTLMNVATGVYAADAGEMRLGGAPAGIRGPRDAVAAGIGMVHQHFRLVDAFTAAENLLLAAGGRKGLASRAEAAAALAAAAEEVGFPPVPEAAIGDLALAERQRVEILKVIALGAGIVILDEPTAVLTDQEAASLLTAVRRLAASGRAVVLITHKLREVVAHSDRVTVMRAGRTVAAGLPAEGMTIAELARLMVGETAPPAARPVAATPGPHLLVAAGITAARADGGVGIADVSLGVRAGEILGVAGVGGNGQQQLADAVLGLAAITTGSLTIDGTTVTDTAVADRRRLGLRVIPADRMAGGLIGDFSVADNLALTSVAAAGGLLGWLDRRRRNADAAAAIAAYDIAGATPSRRTRLLSGGNAQKLIVARELGPGARVLLVHSPTRGLDVRAAAFVHAAIRAAVAGGAACLLISEDLEEILALADRIAVMSAGRIVGERPAGATSQEIGTMMLGHA